MESTFVFPIEGTRSSLPMLLAVGAAAVVAGRLAHAQSGSSLQLPNWTMPQAATSLVAVFAVVWLLRGRRWRAGATPATESLTILPSLGLLLGSSRAPAASHFLPLARISRVVLNEALEGFGARSYLGVVLHGGKEVVVAFPNCRVWLMDLEPVYQAVQKQLWFADSTSDARPDGAS